VEVDHRRRGADGGYAVRLGVVADEDGHFVAVLLQFGQYVRSDEPAEPVSVSSYSDVLLS